MGSTDNWLVHEHSLYEELLSRCQEAADTEAWETAGLTFRELVTHLKRHMALEEEVLYPAYESSAHAPQGPTTALREEHDNIVRMLRDMARVLQTRDSDLLLECLALLENLMIKHHEKEEDIFLPMASHILNSSRDELMRRLAEYDVTKSRRKWEI